MKNSIKLEKVKHFLDENSIKYEEREKRFGHSDLWLPKARVAIKIEGDDSMAFLKPTTRLVAQYSFVKMKRWSLSSKSYKQL
ncbi:hypothetical protein [Prevotella disiens]|uniref:Uncharacterized protein n=1 Tax=Prevotella disiens DNF00882 TaxID=1401075 RepID=A0A096APY2_9BACT|nr:hypothetical protein [Prevotella disiens]KGF48775.1 hypothetical protein HMPREF0654_07915 [Prevotella disiens DNF00882]